MIIGARYNGPPGSGNGGYTAGLVAAQAPWPAEVTLRVPPPIDTELAVTIDGELVKVTDPAGTLVAEARPVEAPHETVPAVSLAEATAISKAYPGFVNHPFPTCFVCGPGRPDRDGLAIYPGRLEAGRTAAPFAVPADISAELMWAALDCPGGWTVAQEGERPYVLGRCAAQIDRLPEPGTQCVAMGLVTGTEGRKAFTITTLYGPDGEPLATARATWIAI